MGLGCPVAALFFGLNHDARAARPVPRTELQHRVADLAVPNRSGGGSGLGEEIPAFLGRAFQVAHQGPLKAVAVGCAGRLCLALRAERRHFAGHSPLEGGDGFALLLGDLQELPAHSRQGRGLGIEGELVGNALLRPLYPMN